MYIKNIIFILACIIGGCVGQSQTQPNETKQKETKKIVTQNTKGWLVNYEEVYERSIKENKPIMANFTGSDWCGWCIKLKKAVFNTETFQNWAADNVILFELDFPRRTPQDPDIKAQNRNLQQTFGQLVRGYPTVLIFDIERAFDNDDVKQTDGIKLLGKLSYMGDPTSFINVANTHIKNRVK